MDGSSLATYRMVITWFQVSNKLNRARVFQKTFLLADNSINIILGIPFLTLNNTNIIFVERKLTWKSYIIAEVLPTIWQVKIIDKKKFTKVALDENVKASVVYMVLLISKILIHPA